jgi:hypothetical protein
MRGIHKSVFDLCFIGGYFETFALGGESGGLATDERGFTQIKGQNAVIEARTQKVSNEPGDLDYPHGGFSLSASICGICKLALMRPIRTASQDSRTPSRFLW